MVVSDAPGPAGLLTLQRGGPVMQFFLGIILFVVVLGIMDARLPWPSGKGRRP